MDTILLLDTSGSMGGNPLVELKRAVAVFINNASQIGLDERIAIIEFGGNTRTLCHLTNNYNSLLAASNRMIATGSTPMAEGLILALKEIKDNAVIHSIEDIILMPRIILMTDGQPDKRDDVLAVTRLCAEIGLPIACVGVSGCDAQLLMQVARISGGMFVMASDITKLSMFFLHQILMTLFIVKMIKQMENLLNRELFRQFIYEQTGEQIDDATLDAMISMISNLTKRKSSSSSNRISAPSSPRPTTGLLPYREEKQEFFLCFACITFFCGFLIPYCWCCGALALFQCNQKSATFMGLVNALLFIGFTIGYFILWNMYGDIYVGTVVYFALICVIFGSLCCCMCIK